ncbi:putative 26S proteasome regulatory subunit [Scheffersomyces coipomensis]|uniref:putative 26S proteasome regulatory subunit n=1 Tax=Scheffersomyces coipomensis TaxID=1788519 RepID=UPI00315C6F6A
MTIDESDISDDSFRGLMKNLNLDESQFQEYQTNYEELSFQRLSQIKQIIESQLSLLFDLLKQKYNADMDTKLLTSDGFPRNDIDVVSIRLIRVKIIRLRNDHKHLLKVLEVKLVEHFQSIKDTSSESNTVEPSQSTSESASSTIKYTVPFARVSEIAPNGPAFNAGLQEGDKIVLFDNHIHAANHNRLSGVVSSVKNGINKSIPVEILRDNNQSTILYLKPTNNWGGQGLLGCRLIPL